VVDLVGWNGGGLLDLEFTVEPFLPAQPGPHVTAPIDAATASGPDVTVGRSAPG
jgi:hypothetical protein